LKHFRKSRKLKILLLNSKGRGAASARKKKGKRMGRVYVERKERRKEKAK
jgi:hypothetical protein